MSKLLFEDRDQVNAELAKVRSDSSETNWAVFGYKGNNSGSNTIVHVASGEGGFPELKAALQPDAINYCLLRVIDIIDDHPTVKFVYIHWIGDKVKFMQKAKTTTHKGGVDAFMGQAHVQVVAEGEAELDETVVMEKVQDASGSASRVLDTASKQRVNSPAKIQTASPAASKTPTKKTELQLNVPDNKDAINAVRSDSDETDWALFGYEGESNNLVVVGQGSGGLEELKAHLKPDQIFYGLLRVVDTIDGRPYPKFVFINWVGEGVKTVRKALITTHNGAVTRYIGQYHVDVSPSTEEELTLEDIMHRVTSASGSASHVTDTVADARVHLSGGI
ncbi:Drebrin-like protein-like [Balamuthia mandrillaris]